MSIADYTHSMLQTLDMDSIWSTETVSAYNTRPKNFHINLYKNTWPVAPLGQIFFRLSLNSQRYNSMFQFTSS